jgi:hypothetical protein
MTRFHDRDLTGARFERVNLRDAQSKGVDLTGMRMRGVELVDVAPPHAGAGDGFREASPALRGWPGWCAAPPRHGTRWICRGTRRPVGTASRGTREARPSLDEVLTVRRERQAMVRHILESLTDAQLAADVTRTEPGWPQMENFPRQAMTPHRPQREVAPPAVLRA